MKIRKYNPERHNRKSIRLKGFDYTQPALFFVTILIRNRECKLGEISNGKVILSEMGKVVKEEWLRTAEIRDHVGLGAFVIMPNHIHGIVAILDGVGQRQYAKVPGNTPPKFEIRPKSLGSIIGGFKSAVTKRLNQSKGFRDNSIWHRNYHERIIRNEEQLIKAEKYIANNPKNWKFDTNFVK